MAKREGGGGGGGSKIFRGVLIAVVTVGILVVAAAFWGDVVHGLKAIGNYVADHYPDEASQQASVIALLVFAVLISIIFSKAGHFTAYGVAMGLVVLAALTGFGLAKLAPKATLPVADLLGGLLLGAGIALAGACLGTVLAQIGAGYRDAWFTLAGGLLGAGLGESRLAGGLFLPNAFNDYIFAIVGEETHAGFSAPTSYAMELAL